MREGVRIHAWVVGQAGVKVLAGVMVLPCAMGLEGARVYA